MRPLPISPVFTTAEAYAAGWTDSALLCAVRSGRLVRLRRAVYARAGRSDELLAARSIAASNPGVTLTHLTAARVLGIPIVGRRPDRVEVTVAPRTNADVPGAHVYRARLREHDTVDADGLLVSSAARTVVDIARHYGLVTSVPAIDHALHSKMVSGEELVDAFEFCRTWPGGKRARKALMLCDSRSESPLESISRLAIARLGLPAPEPQVKIFDASGAFIGRGDFYWDEFGVVGEADGFAKYDDAEAKDAEHDRESGFDNVNLEVTRWGWRRAQREEILLGKGVRKAFERGLARDRAGLPRLWTAASTPRVHVL